MSTSYLKSSESAHPLKLEASEIAPFVRSNDATQAATTTVLDHAIAQHSLTALRNRRTVAPEFRDHCKQLLLVLALEATRTLPTTPKLVPTTVRDFEGRGLAKPIVFLSVTRPALGIASCVIDLIPGVIVGSVSVNSSGSGDRPEARLHVFHTPPLNAARVIVFDPIVATGLSATLALSVARRSGANDIALASFVMSAQGLGRIRTAFPGVPIWTAAVDHDWDAKLGPLPGIWNFADRLCD